MSSETQSGKLTDELIAKLAPVITSDNMEIIALLYLGFVNEDVNRIKTNAGNNAEKFIRELLIEWKNKNKEKATVETLRNELNTARLYGGYCDIDKIDEVLGSTTDDLTAWNPPSASLVYIPIETTETEFQDIAAKVRLAAKHENRTPFCELISDRIDEIEFLLRLEKPKKKKSMLENYALLFKDKDKDNPQEPKRILLKDDNGMGKISVMRRIEWDWGKQRFKRFSLVLLVSLRFMKLNDQLEDIILRQNFQLREIPLNSKKLRKILENYGQSCLLLLDGWGEHTCDSKDVLNIIKGDSLADCSVVLSSRSDFMTEEISGCFSTVFRCEGFPKEYAEIFAENILYSKDKVKAVLDVGIHKYELGTGGNYVGERLYKNPVLFLFVCIVFDEIIEFPIDVGELYFKAVRLLYQRYSLKGEVFDRKGNKHESEYPVLLKAVGRVALKMLKHGPFNVNRKTFLDSKGLGHQIYHWAILSDHMYRFPTSTMPDHTFLTFPCFSVQEFFAAFYYHKFAKQEEKNNTETHEVIGEVLSEPRECFQRYKVLHMSKMFHAFFDWQNREMRRDANHDN